MVANIIHREKAARPRHVFASRRNDVIILIKLAAAWQSPWNSWQYYTKELATKFSEISFQLQTLCSKTFRKDVSVYVCHLRVSPVAFLAAILPNYKI